MQYCPLGLPHELTWLSGPFLANQILQISFIRITARQLWIHTSALPLTLHLNEQFYQTQGTTFTLPLAPPRASQIVHEKEKSDHLAKKAEDSNNALSHLASTFWLGVVPYFTWLRIKSLLLFEWLKGGQCLALFCHIVKRWQKDNIINFQIFLWLLTNVLWNLLLLKGLPYKPFAKIICNKHGWIPYKECVSHRSSHQINHPQLHFQSTTYYIVGIMIIRHLLQT